MGPTYQNSQDNIPNTQVPVAAPQELQWVEIGEGGKVSSLRAVRAHVKRRDHDKRRQLKRERKGKLAEAKVEAEAKAEAEAKSKATEKALASDEETIVELDRLSDRNISQSPPATICHYANDSK